MEERFFWLSVRQALSIITNSICRYYCLDQKLETKRGEEKEYFVTSKPNWVAIMVADVLTEAIRHIEEEYKPKRSVLRN